MKNKITQLLIAGLSVGASQAVTVWSDNFDSYASGTPMSSMGGWVVTNGVGAGGVAEQNAVFTNATFNGSAGAALVGGYQTTSLQSTVASNITASLLMGESTTSFDITYEESGVPIPAARSSFQVGIGTATGSFPAVASLLTINFAPKAGDLNVYVISFSSEYLTPLQNSALPTTELNTANFTNFTIQTTNNGVFPTMAVSSGLMAGFSVALPASTLSHTIEDFSVSWLGTTGPTGDSYVTFDNISMIPEPSSALLIGLSALGFIRRKR